LNVGERLAPRNAGPAALWLVGPRRYHRYCPATGRVTLPSSEQELPPVHARAAFGRATYRVPIADGRIVTVASDVLGYSWHDAEGRVRGVRMPAAAPAVSAAERAELEAADTYIGEHFPAIFQPSRAPLPAHKQLVVGAVSDPTGLLWLARSGPGVLGAPRPAVRVPDGPSPPMLRYHEPVLFSAFAASGAYLGDVRFPDGVEHLVFAGRVAWGVMEAEDGTEVLVRFDIPLRAVP
ncbi:MAG: hypothetical protein LC667_06115, partial [Thioalkalivibrio sp.]|nr:hypothetical protein [Thioalkalivibrio sp.]